MFTWSLQFSEVRLLLWKQHSLCVSSHPASMRFWMQGKASREDFLHEDTEGVIKVSYGLSLCQSNITENILTPDRASVDVSETPGSVLAALINSPADKPQAHNEFIHCIQQPVIASSWQHGPSTSATSLGEISPGWQKSASDGMLGTYLFFSSAVIRIKSSCALPASLSKKDVPLPGESDTRGAGFPCVTDSIKSPACLFLHYDSTKILHELKYILNFIYSEGNNSFGCERVNKEENHTQCVLKVRGIISHLKNTT